MKQPHEYETPITDNEIFNVYESQRPELRMAVPVETSQRLEQHRAMLRAALEKIKYTQTIEEAWRHAASALEATKEVKL